MITLFCNTCSQFLRFFFCSIIFVKRQNRNKRITERSVPLFTFEKGTRSSSVHKKCGSRFRNTVLRNIFLKLWKKDMSMSMAFRFQSFSKIAFYLGAYDMPRKWYLLLSNAKVHLHLFFYFFTFQCCRTGPFLTWLGLRYFCCLFEAHIPFHSYFLRQTHSLSTNYHTTSSM